MPCVWPTPLSRVAKFDAGADVELSLDLEEGGLDGADQNNGHHVLCGLASVGLEKISRPTSFDTQESRYPHWCPRPR
jgi:hypothetical protein